MANKFLEQMKASDWINLGQLATNVVGGAMSGKAAERTAEQAKTQDTWNRLLQQYNAQMAARNQLAAYYDQLNATRAAGRQALLNASPLGEEQEYVGKQALRRGLMGVMGNFQPLAPASADIAGLIRPTSNVLSAFTTPDMQQAASVGATARSLAERRKAKAGVDPTFQFGSMADYGVPNLEKEVATYAQGVAADRLSRENKLLDLLTTQMQAANALSQPQPTQGVPSTQSTTASQPKKTSWWKKVLNVAATAAPIVAAPFTGGTSLALIGAGSGALKGALSGGAKGALTGAAMGAATSAIGGGAAGAAAQRGAGEAASAAIKRAILNPRALTQLGGAAIGGPVEQAAQVISPFLPGARAFKPGVVAGFENQMPPGWQGPQRPIVGPGAEGFSTEFTSPPPPDAPILGPFDTTPPVPPPAPPPAPRGFWDPVEGANYPLNPQKPSVAGPGGTTRPAVSAFEANTISGIPVTSEVTSARHPYADTPFFKIPIGLFGGTSIEQLGQSGKEFVNRLARSPEGFDVWKAGQAPVQSQPPAVFDPLTIPVAAQNAAGAPTRRQLQTIVTNTATRRGIDPALLQRVAAAESSFNPSAVSPKGARGVMQVMPATAAELLGGAAAGLTAKSPEVLARLVDPVTNIDLGAQYFAQMLRQFNNDPMLAAAAYNAGPGALRKVLASGGRLPKETEDYVQKITGKPFVYPTSSAANVQKAILAGGGM